MEIHAITGAFGYSGKYIAQRLLAKGCRVITLTNSTERINPFKGLVRPFPFNFDKPDQLVESLQNVAVLYNTFWVRFNHKMFKHADAVRNTITLFNAAKKAGVRRIVHISITNPSEDSPFDYFRGKAQLEKALRESGLSYAILRPAVLFGKEDILVNNIAWVLRRLPIFGVFGNGEYRLQPIYVDDLAQLAVDEGEKDDDVVINAIGPETFTYRSLVEAVGKIIGRQRPIISVPPVVGYITSRIIGSFVHDMLLTRDEIKGLMAGLLYVNSPPVGKTRLTDWAKKYSELIGRKYASELARRKDRRGGYI